MKKIKLLVTTIILSISFFISNSVHASTTRPNVIRLDGINRYETCSKVVNESWSQCDYAILVNSNMFADAVASSPLSQKYDAPILLTEGNNLTSSTKEQLQRLSVKNVYIIGGTGVISDDVVSSLKSLDINVKRIGGKNRYETSIDVAKELSNNVNGFFIVSGDNFKDALAVSPIAAKMQYAIILISKGSVPESVKSYLANNKDKDLVLVGGSDVLNNNIFDELKSAKIYNQGDTYKRNLALIKDYKEKLDLSKVFIASDLSFADALSGSALAIKSSNPIILLGDSNEESTSEFINKNNIKNIDILGGRGVISNNSANYITGNTAVSNDSLDAIPDNTDLSEDQMEDLLCQLQGDWYKQIYLKDKNITIPYDGKVINFSQGSSKEYQLITSTKADAFLEVIHKVKKVSKNQYLLYAMDGTAEYDTLFTLNNDNNTITLNYYNYIPTNDKFTYNENLIRTNLPKALNNSVLVGKFTDAANNIYEFKNDLTAVWPNKSFRYTVKQLDWIGQSYLITEYDLNGYIVNRYVSEDTGNTRTIYLATENKDKWVEADPDYVAGIKWIVLNKCN